MKLILREQRKKKRLSIQAAAARTGVAPSTYRDWEAGAKIPAEFLPGLSATLGLSVGDLLGVADARSERLKKALLYLETSIELLRESLL